MQFEEQPGQVKSSTYRGEETHHLTKCTVLIRQASSRQKYAGRIESLAARVMKREYFNATEKMHLGLKTPVLVLATAEEVGTEDQSLVISQRWSVRR